MPARRSSSSQRGPADAGAICFSIREKFDICVLFGSASWVIVQSLQNARGVLSDVAFSDDPPALTLPSPGGESKCRAYSSGLRHFLLDPVVSLHVHLLGQSLVAGHDDPA